jgi:hypothetical protein
MLTQAAASLESGLQVRRGWIHNSTTVRQVLATLRLITGRASERNYFSTSRRHLLG